MSSVSEQTPTDGSLPEQVLLGAAQRQFGVYVHVPYCRVRCGYCDFNTYTATELKGTTQKQYAEEAMQEMSFASQVMMRTGLPEREAETVFFGGGTPTLLPHSDLKKMLQHIKEVWGIAETAEVNVEANPDSVDEEYIAALAEAGFTRVSIGMQSAQPHVLKTLDRTHNPESVGLVVSWVKSYGMQASVDLIYGTPGETLQDWRETLEIAISYKPDHISAYALIIEEGTKLARNIKRGLIDTPDDDLQASMYELADQMLTKAGFNWYELSNWAVNSESVSRHNIAYWTNTDWWGIGPGAHSHIGGVRWWNVKHPAAYAERIERLVSPSLEREVLTFESRILEEVLLKTRLAEGMPVVDIPWDTKQALTELIAEGLIDDQKASRGSIVLTLQGRLLADAVVRKLTDVF